MENKKDNQYKDISQKPWGFGNAELLPTMFLAQTQRPSTSISDIPKNILIDEAGRARLIDFGVERLRHAWSVENSGAVSGTLA